MNNYIKIKNTSASLDDCIIGADISENTSLYDIFVTYYIDNKLKIIKLDDMIGTVILYDGDVTLIVNPLTLASCIYYGHVTIIDIDKDTGQLLLKRSPEEPSFKLGETILYIGKSQLNIKTIQCKIMVLRDIFMFDSDPVYIKIKNPQHIIPKAYMENKQDMHNNIIHETYHPKTLVYVIGYTSTSGKRKHTIIIGRGANSKTPTGFNFKNSKFSTYIKVYADKLEEMQSYIYPMFWFSANKIFGDAKIIVL
jgi:hypothetical protein